MAASVQDFLRLDLIVVRTAQPHPGQVAGVVRAEEEVALILWHLRAGVERRPDRSLSPNARLPDWIDEARLVRGPLGDRVAIVAARNDPIDLVVADLAVLGDV